MTLLPGGCQSFEPCIEDNSIIPHFLSFGRGDYILHLLVHIYNILEITGGSRLIILSFTYNMSLIDYLIIIANSLRVHVINNKTAPKIKALSLFNSTLPEDVMSPHGWCQSSMQFLGFLDCLTHTISHL